MNESDADFVKAIRRQWTVCAGAVLVWATCVLPAAHIYGITDTTPSFVGFAFFAFVCAFVDGIGQPGRRRQLDHNIIWACCFLHCSTLHIVVGPAFARLPASPLSEAVLFGVAVYLSVCAPPLVQGLFGIRPRAGERSRPEAKANTQFASIAFGLGSLYALPMEQGIAERLTLPGRAIIAFLAIASLFSAPLAHVTGSYLRHWLLGYRRAITELTRLGRPLLVYVALYLVAIGAFAMLYAFIARLDVDQFAGGDASSLDDWVDLSWRTQTTFGGAMRYPLGPWGKSFVSIQSLGTFVWTTVGVAAVGMPRNTTDAGSLRSSLDFLLRSVGSMRRAVGFYLVGYAVIVALFGLWIGRAWADHAPSGVSCIEPGIADFMFVSLMTVTTVGQEEVDMAAPALRHLAAFEVTLGVMWTGVVVFILSAQRQVVASSGPTYDGLASKKRTDHA